MITTLTTAALISISIEVMCIHLLIGLLFVFLNCFIAGFSGEAIKSSDFRDLIMWPFTLFSVLGLCTRGVAFKVKAHRDEKHQKRQDDEKRQERTKRHKETGSKTKEE